MTSQRCLRDQSVLEQARTYARVNNTYSWVGFYEENGSIPSTNPPTRECRLVISSIASPMVHSLRFGSGTMDPVRLVPLASWLRSTICISRSCHWHGNGSHIRHPSCSAVRTRRRVQLFPIRSLTLPHPYCAIHKSHSIRFRPR